MLERLISVCICLTVVCLMFPYQGSAGIDPATCAGAWIFDAEDEKVVADISGNENNGVVKGDPKWDEGKFGAAIALDGANDYLNCGNQDSLSIGTEDFSLVAWMMCEKYTPDSWAGCVISKFDTNAPRHGYLFGVRGVLDANNKEKPLFLMGLGQDSGAHMYGTQTINDGAWHHIAATVDRDGAAIFYRDGNLESQMDIAASAKENEDNALNLNIGGDSDGRWLLNAVIDEVALFKTVLTQGDIKRIMTDGLERVLGLVAVSPAGRLTTTWASVKAQVR